MGGAGWGGGGGRAFPFPPYLDGAIFVWPWNEKAQTKQKQQTNGNRAIWLVYRTDTNGRGFWLVKRTLWWKKVMPENFLETNRYFALTSYWPIKQCLLHIRVFSGGKTKRLCFNLFIHWLIKQIGEITNTYRNHLSRSYENHSNRLVEMGNLWFKRTPPSWSSFFPIINFACLLFSHPILWRILSCDITPWLE